MLHYSNGMFYVIIALIFSDLLNVIISTRSSETSQFSVFNRRISQNEDYRSNPRSPRKFNNSSETAASSQKGMMSTNSDDENHIQINDFQSVSSNSTRNSSKMSSPQELFTVKEAKTSEEIPRSSMMINSIRPVQLPRRKSDIFPESSQMANTRLSICLFTLVLSILILLKIYKIGVISALIMGLFLRLCVKMCNGFCLECSILECIDRCVGDKNVCGIGFFPSPRLAAKRRLDKEKMYQEICKREQQVEDNQKERSINEGSSLGYVSMQIDRNVLYQRLGLVFMDLINIKWILAIKRRTTITR